MLYLAENLRKYRIAKNLTQEDVAELLHITPQSVSKWERGETAPDIAFLPALANIYETSIDLLMGMDTIRAAEAKHNIHSAATKAMRDNPDAAEKIYRDALLLYPNDPGMLLGLAGVLALNDAPAEAIPLIERGLPNAASEKQTATMRALLCFLYLRHGDHNKAQALANSLPHVRECRETIAPIIAAAPDADEIASHIRTLLLGE